MGLSQRLGDSFKLVRRCGIFVYASFKLAKRDRKSFYQACSTLITYTQRYPEVCEAYSRCVKTRVPRIANTTNLITYLGLIQPVRSPSLEIVRIGGVGDGGYCMLLPPPLHELDSGSQPIALSLGVSSYAPWDLEMADRGYKVLEFDGSIATSPYPNHPNIQFSKLFVGVSDSKHTIALSRVLAESSLDPSAHNILQCDIENAEWEILDTMCMDDLTPFSQLIFEFHGCDPDDEQGSVIRLRVLQKLREYFTPIHTHYNNIAGSTLGVIDDLAYPFCPSLEISYLRNDLVPDDARLVYGLASLEIDSPCSANKPDIPVIFPPLSH